MHNWQGISHILMKVEYCQKIHISKNLLSLASKMRLNLRPCIIDKELLIYQ